MRATQGSIVKRSKTSWSLVITSGYVMQDGKRKRKQKWVTFPVDPDPKKSKENKAAAQAKLAELLTDLNKGTFIEPSKVTLIAWLNAWLEKSVKPPMRRPGTYRVYDSIVRTQIAPSSIAGIPLQRLTGSDIERYYSESGVAASSLAVHHAILHRALKRAVKDRVLSSNPCTDLERRRATANPAKRAREKCWSLVEVKRVLEAAKTVDPQLCAFVYLALDAGARTSELHGLTWGDVDLEAAELTIHRQLDRAGAEPVWGPTKNKGTRTLTLGDETVARLRAHKQAQAELKMRNRTTYQDFNLIFAKEEVDRRAEARLGEPLKVLDGRRFEALIKVAGVKRITIHGCRHSVATMLLQAGTPPHVVAHRLGHTTAELLKTYAHALPGQQQDAAARLGALLHG